MKSYLPRLVNTTSAELNLFGQYMDQCLNYYLYYLWKTPTIQDFGIWVISIDSDDLPVHFSLVNHGQDAEHFYFNHLTWKAHLRNRPTNDKQTINQSTTQYQNLYFRSACKLSKKPHHITVSFIYTHQTVLPGCQCHKRQWDHCHHNTLFLCLCGLDPPMSFPRNSTKHVRNQTFKQTI